MLTRVWGHGARMPARRLLWASQTSKSLCTVADSTAFQQSATQGSNNKEKKTKTTSQLARLAPALQIYHKHTGHWVVPYHFAIPEANDQHVRNHSWHHDGRVYGLVDHVGEIPWPEQARGLSLGRVLDKFLKNNMAYQAKHPHVVTQLQEIGYCVELSRRQYEWKHQTFAALQTFFNIHGHSIVPVKFEVPRDETQWPVATWGFPLGEIVGRMRFFRDKLTPGELADLERIAFSFDKLEATWSQKILPSLEVFAQVYGHCRVSQRFEVPHTAPWPQTAWGLKLGWNVSMIRSSGAFTDQVARDLGRLEAINFVWNASEHKWSEIILPSLQVFRQVYGHCDVPRAFVVPTQAPWPEDAWDLQLGYTVTHMRSDGYFADQVDRDADQLDAIGFVWDPRRERWENVVLPAFEFYHRLNGHLRIPARFVVPTQAPWPEKTWGLTLGSALEKIKRRGDYADGRKRDQARLAAIGFPIMASR